MRPQQKPRRSVRSLQKTRKTARVDFIKFHSVGPGLKERFPALCRVGNRSTLHDLTGADLCALQDLQKNSNLVSLEFSLDFFPKNHDGSKSAIFKGLEEVLSAVMLNINPWVNTSLPKRVCLSRGKGESDVVIDDAWMPKLANAVTEHTLTRLSVDWSPTVCQEGGIVSPTVYIGHRVFDFWDGEEVRQASDHQMRIYIKRTDSGAQLPLRKWRVRVEVTLGRRELARRGLLRVGDITQRHLSAIAADYIFFAAHTPFAEPPVPKSRRRPRKARGGAILKAVNERRLKVWRQATSELDQIASTKGYLYCSEYMHLAKWSPFAEMQQLTRQAVYDFMRHRARPAASTRLRSKDV